MSSVEYEYAGGTKGFFCKWKIENFSYQLKNWMLFSPQFPVALLSNSKWGLCMFKKESIIHSNSLVCYLKRYSDDGPVDVELYYEFFIISAAGALERKSPPPMPCKFPKDCCGPTVILLGNENYETNMAGLLSKDTFTVCCRMWWKGIVDSMEWFIRTPINIQERCLKWTIHGFSSLVREEFRLEYSKEDPSPFGLVLSWIGDCSKEQMQIEIIQTEPYRRQRLTSKIILLSDKGILFSGVHEFEFEGNPTEVCKLPPFLHKKWLLDNRDIYLRNDTLSLQIEMKMSDACLDGVEKIHFGEVSDFEYYS